MTIAQKITLPGGIEVKGPLAGGIENKSPAAIISQDIVPIIFVFAGFILLIMLLVSGYQFIMSRGDPKALDQARGRLTFAIIGFLVVFGSYWLLVILNTYILGGLIDL